MNVSDRILVIYEGEIVGEFDPKTTTVQEFGLYMPARNAQTRESEARTRMKLKRILYSNGFISLLASIASICFGLLLGFIHALLLQSAVAITGFKSLISAGFRSSDSSPRCFIRRRRWS